MSQYNNPDYPSGMPRPSGPTHVDVNAVGVVTPTDRVRWGPIWAGFLTTLTTWIVLMLLGAALGLSLWDRGDDPNTYRVGAAIWMAVVSLLAFAFGGWMAARTAAVQGSRNGMINGFMVWALGIPVLLLLLGGGIGAALGLQGTRTGGNVIRASVQAPDAGQPAATITDEQRQTATSTAWWTLLWLVLSLIAAAAAGSAAAAIHRDGGRRDVVATP